MTDPRPSKPMWTMWAPIGALLIGALLVLWDTINQTQTEAEP